MERKAVTIRKWSDRGRSFFCTAATTLPGPQHLHLQSAEYVLDIFLELAELFCK